MYRYLLHNPDLMDSIVESSTPLGIAVALDSGLFQVYRFSMKGGKDAIGAVVGRDTATQNPGFDTRLNALIRHRTLFS